MVASAGFGGGTLLFTMPPPPPPQPAYEIASTIPRLSTMLVRVRGEFKNTLFLI
jgi:hypothetical protein